jgi:hypothetical protein
VEDTWGQAHFVLEVLEGNEAKFDLIANDGLVWLTQWLDQLVVSLSALDAWSIETAKLRRLIGATTGNLANLRDKAVGPLVGLHNCCTDRGSPIPGKLESAIWGCRGTSMPCRQDRV